MFRLIIDMILDLLTHLWLFEIVAKMKTKCKIWLKCQFLHRTTNCRKICNAPLDALMCPLQIINNSEPLSLTLHGVNACFIHHPSNVQNYLICYKLRTSQSKKKGSSKLHIFTPFCKFLTQNSKYPSLQKFGKFFDIWAIST